MKAADPMARNAHRLLARVSVASFVALTLGLVACEDPVVAGPAPSAGRGSSQAPVSPAQPAPGQAPAAVGGAAQASSGPADLPRFADSAFVEAGVQNRDPFRAFADAFATRAPQQVQRRVLLPNVSVEDMRLIAIITGLPQPRAMVLDSAQVGWVVKRGDYIGRPEVVQTGGAEGVPVTLNWRVDRIRDSQVVLTREDPTAPGRPALTRILPLRVEEPNPLLEQIDGPGEETN